MNQGPAFAELVAATNFSFLRGASSGEHMVLYSLALGLNGLGIADRNTVAGVVRAYAALKQLREEGTLPTLKLREGSGPGEFREQKQIDVPAEVVELLRTRAQTFKLVTGTRLVFADGTPDIVVHPQNRLGWGNICRLLTLGNRRTKKGECHLELDDLLRHAGDTLLVAMPPREPEQMAALLPKLREVAPGAVWLAASMHRRGNDRRRLTGLKALADGAGVPLLATNETLYSEPGQRDLQDVLTCIRNGVSIDRAGRLLEANAERHLKAPAEMARLFADCPQAIGETQDFLLRVDFSVGELKYEYPDEPIPPGKDPQSWLEELTWRHAAMCYRDGLPAKVEGLLRDELKLIAKLKYARYFLTIYDIVEFANSKGILCQGRGSAANSAVCYVLGITAVDPNEHDLLFARFISTERIEPPDIDVDFEHERREEVIQYLYEKYGRDRAGIAATVIHYRPRSAIREAGKALGLSEDVTAALANTQWGSYESDITRTQIRQAGLDPDNPEIVRAVGFARRLLGFPRHLSQHVGGFVLSRSRLDETVPIGNAAMEDRTFIEWDKDDIDTLGLMKVDVLALGMLTCISKALKYLDDHKNVHYKLNEIPSNDGETYAMLQRGESIGVFQVESRAQMNMLPRLKPENLYDLVIQVAIVRPGPIQGNMVHPYLKRRAGEKVDFPSPSPDHGPPDELRQVLEKTKGVPLFQEQAMRIAMVAAKFTPEEANRLRRAMATFRNLGTIGEFEEMMVGRMIERGYDPDFAKNCFEQIKGFGSYGFPESHAASFAKLVYISAWIKCHHPDVFACALLNSQPMGFYAPAQIVRDAEGNGVEVRPIDINHSDWDNTLEEETGKYRALRLGFRQMQGVHEAEAGRIVVARGAGFDSVEALSVRAALHGRPLRALADADAFRSIGLERRRALWEVSRLPDDDPLPLFLAADARELAEEPDAGLPEMPIGEHVATDYQTMRLSLKGHPMKILRPIFQRERILSCKGVGEQANGAFARVAGIVLVRQRPGKGNAIFVTLEDETGVANIVLWASKFEHFRREVMGARLMMVEGRVQKSPEGVVHLMAQRIFDRSVELDRLWEGDRAGLTLPAAVPLAPSITSTPPPRHGHPRNVRVLPKSRDFH
ncbi:MULTISPECIES: error-prone DNA polymerase [Mesorhizobium]|uniref:Error-prone DNA polymerase n=1 Tax=Mesorhizobium denitrificans TaxID=2294114 RepID=A0A371XJB4_9HYPH|nr:MULTISPECIES: error-prone DNA polymerase [Mesorhizobium]RFC69303.1 DNA polymerase III subunit alpha [Mesorhizobium denitrificans]